MTTSIRTKKRKHSPSPTRKKARTETDTTETPTPTPRSTTFDEQFADLLQSIGDELPDPQSTPQPLVGPPTGTQTVLTTPTVTGPKPPNPFAGKAKRLRNNFGDGYHDVAHFQETRNKSYHGVWEGKRKKVQAWVRMALNSIYNDDHFVVASNMGKNGGYNYLISMDGTTIGYLSGFSVPLGQKPPSKHIEIYLDKKGNTVSAFPSSPEIF